MDGFGIALSVLYGKLRVEDGIGRQRRSLALDRAGSGLERLVLIGKAGLITLDAPRGYAPSAPRWCRSGGMARFWRTLFRSAIMDTPSAALRRSRSRTAWIWRSHVT